MAAKSFLRLVAGKVKAIQATVVSTGAANDGDIVALDGTGKIDVSILPVGVGPDVELVVCSEDLGAGDYINVFDDNGTRKVRLADNTNGRDAHGFVKSAFTTGESAVVYFEGPNNNLSGLTIGSRMYLGTAGGVISAPLAPITDAGKIHQFLGYAVNSDTVNTDIDDLIQL